MPIYIVSVDLPVYDVQSEEEAIEKFRKQVQGAEAAIFSVEKEEE